MERIGIASILHRETIAMIVGGRTFERGEQCFVDRRVLGVETGPGELCGIVKPQEAGRAAYEIRIWVHEDGLAYKCSCPVGASRQFCKHAVAVALAHLEKEHAKAELRIENLREQLMNVSLKDLFDGLLHHARAEPAVLSALTQLCEGR